MDAVVPLAKSADEWKNRPAGIPNGVPPPSVPLSFLVAAVLGLMGCGVAILITRSTAVVDPTDDRVVGVAHLAMLATLSMGVLGAIHQFAPVITQRPFRSVRLSRVTFITWLIGSWLLPIGFMAQLEGVVEAGGMFAALAVTLFVINITPSLAVQGKGAPVTGLRFAVIGFVVTACYGVVYVIDRRGNWFNLSGHVVLAHASVGLLAWLGLTYFSVSEKLWPMFMLAHVPGRHRNAWLGIWSLFIGVLLLSPGLLFAIPWLAIAGALTVSVGFGAHICSLITYIRHRRRAADLHLVFIVSSTVWLVAGVGFASSGAMVMRHHHHLGVALVAATISALAGWLLVAMVGHAYKIVPFIVWSSLRGRGISKKVDGSPLMFADLFNHRWSAVDCALINGGVLAICLGFAASTSWPIGVGGGLLVGTGLITAMNLSWRPIRLFCRPSALRDATDNPASITVAAQLRSKGPTDER
ncbi:MAG: hypothetical protein HKL86_10240 [Acidimicrobiaceae bacterium]|nr:hypothetical protein [Acidimicrobiaceae bacterium]